MKYIVSEIKCIRCKKQFSEHYFLSYVHGNGMKKTKQCYYCRISRLEAPKTNYIEAKQIVLNWKQQNNCVDCGLSNYKVIQSDHVRGTKVKNCTKYNYWMSKHDELRIELEKCDSRCRMCHVIKTKKTLWENKYLRNKSWKGFTTKYLYNQKNKKLKTDIINNEKLLRGKCLLCGLKVNLKNVEGFIFDHGVNWEKKTNSVSSLRGQASNCTAATAAPKILKEILLCRLLCSNCDWLETKKHLWESEKKNPHREDLKKYFFIT